MPYKLPLSSNPECIPLPPLGVPLTPEQDAALFAGDVIGVARRIFQGLVEEYRLTAPRHSEQHSVIQAGAFEKVGTNAP